MDNKKIYTIQINGIKESVDAVEALIKQLNDLDVRIDNLNKRVVKVEVEQTNINVSSASTSTSRGSNASAIKEEIQAQKELNQLKKEEAAQQRLVADEYANTMKGMKQNLADLKTVINATDLGDSDSIKNMTKDANALTNKLKEMEQAYGQFGRNVGNYRDAANGFKGLAIQVGDTTKEFDNAKQALKELKKERDTLSTKKDMGLISEEEAKRLQDLIPTVAQLQSSIQDAGKPMDALMDSMQSFIAIMQSAKGISAFFGLDDDAVEESIKKLVALQNAMQGLQTIQKQLQSQEGIGKWLSKGNAAIDAFTKKLFGLNTATKTTNAALASTSAAGKTAAVGLGTASVAATTATKSFSLAAAAATALRVVLSALGIGLVIAAISALVEGVGYLIDKQKEAKKFQEDLNNAIKDGEKEYAKTTVELSQLKNKLDNFNGSKKQEKKLVEELNSKYGTTIGQYKSVKEWKDALIKKGEAYAQVLKLEAENQALLNMYTENYIKLMHAQDLAAKGPDFWDEAAEWLPWNWGGKSAQDKLNDTVNEIESAGNTILDKIEENNKKIAEINKKSGLFDYAPQIEKNTAKTKNAVEDAQKTLNQLELRLMQDGLNKKLRQLDEEERQTINKLKENGRKSGIEIQKIQRAYAQLRAKEIQEYLKTLEGKIKQSAENIKNVQFEINTKDIDNQIDALQNKFEELSKDFPRINSLITNAELGNLIGTKGFEDASRDINSLITVTNSTLEHSFRKRYEDTVEYYNKTIELLKDNIEKQSALNEQRINEQYQQDWDSEVNRYKLLYNEKEKEKELLDDQIKNFKVRNDTEAKALEELKKKRAEIQKQMDEDLRQHGEKQQQLTDAKNNAIKKNEIDTLNEIQAAQERYYNQQLSNYRDFQSKLNDEISRNPVVSKGWGIVNVKQTRRNYTEIINASREALAQIRDDRDNLENDFEDGLISKEVYNATKNQLNDLEKEIKNGIAVTIEADKNLIADFIASTQQYLQAAMDSFQTIMSAVWDAQDVAFDKEQEQLDKENEALEEALNKQQEIVEKHKSAIDSIEDELATSRGDRRQHLIDQFNAEMEAQRRAAEEEKKIQKEKEAIEKRQDELEKERKKAQYKRDLLQAIVNGAMAVTMAAINTWPIPAIPMMALAASTTAAQVAIMAANKPYAKGGQLDGGVAQGKRHSEGGIPVLGGRASIEGGEFITNRQTTAKNVDLLEYINAKHRKLNIDDFISFYSSGSVKKNITSMSPRAKFADGGVIPTLNNEYQFDDRLLSAFEDYANRPYVVSVVDINSRQAAVKNVEVLAGLHTNE